MFNTISVKQVNWALRCYSPLGYKAAKEVKLKWTTAGDVGR